MKNRSADGKARRTVGETIAPGCRKIQRERKGKKGFTSIVDIVHAALYSLWLHKYRCNLLSIFLALLFFVPLNSARYVKIPQRSVRNGHRCTRKEKGTQRKKPRVPKESSIAVQWGKRYDEILGQCCSLPLNCLTCRS